MLTQVPPCKQGFCRQSKLYVSFSESARVVITVGGIVNGVGVQSVVVMTVVPVVVSGVTVVSGRTVVVVAPSGESVK